MLMHISVAKKRAVWLKYPTKICLVGLPWREPMKQTAFIQYSLNHCKEVSERLIITTAVVTPTHSDSETPMKPGESLYLWGHTDT